MPTFQIQICFQMQEIERSGTPFTHHSNAFYRDYQSMRTPAHPMHHYHSKYANHPMMSSQSTAMPMSSPWHPISNGTDWMNTPYNGRPSSYYRNHFSSPESGRHFLPATSLTSPSKNSSAACNGRSSYQTKMMVSKQNNV